MLQNMHTIVRKKHKYIKASTKITKTMYWNIIVIIISKKQNHQEFKIPETDPGYPESEHPPLLSSEVLE